MAPGQDNKTRITQTNNIKTKMLEGIKRYQKVENEYRNRYRSQQKRQIEITNPTMSPEEIEQAVDSDYGQQVFANAVILLPSGNCGGR